MKPRAHALIVALALGCQAGETPGDAPDLGALRMPSVVTGRDGGSAAMVGGQMLWTFNDTSMTKTGADGFNYRSATAAWGTGVSTKITDTLDANGTPFQLIPYTADELAYNRAHPSKRYALWPDAVVPSESGALIFSAYIQIHSSALGDWSQLLGTVVAQVQAGQTVAVRQPGLLFAAPVPSFDAGAIAAGGFLYLYSCDPSPCPVARAPIAQATSSAAWQVWNGADWSSDLTTGVGVIADVPGQLSVSWNAYLNSYLAVHSLPLSNEIVFQTAPSPSGPWSAAQHLMTTQHGSKKPNYAGLEHPELSSDGGRSLVVSYADASEGSGSVLHLAAPTLP